MVWLFGKGARGNGLAGKGAKGNGLAVWERGMGYWSGCLWKAVLAWLLVAEEIVWLLGESTSIGVLV